MKRMTIAFTTLGLQFTGDTLERKGLGGSETALTCLARSLAARGHRVLVFCNCEKQGTFNGVDYFDVRQFPKMSALIPWDVHISSRWPEFLSKPTNAGLRILWLHDTIQSKGRLVTNLWQTDALFLLSDFHIANYTDAENEEDAALNKIGEFKDYIWKTSNGIDMDLIERCRMPKDENKLFYSSRPERGLHFLLKNIFPKLLEQNPDLKLHYCNYSLGNMQVPDHIRQINETCEVLARKLGDSVVNVGHLTKEELYKEMSSAKLLLYPTAFPEISCITAMEAAACGTPIVSTDDFALSETVSSGRTGWLVKGNPMEEDYTSKFIRKVNLLLNNQATYDEFSKAGPEWIKEQGYTWDAVAEAWEGKFLSMMEERFEEKKADVVQELVRKQDLMMAKALGGSTELDVMIEDAKKGIPFPDDAKEATAVVKHSLERFKKACFDLASTGRKVEHILDFACGYEGFGICAARIFPDAKVTMVDRDPNVIQQITANIAAVEMDDQIRVLQGDNLEEILSKIPPVDTLFLGGFLELQEKPHETLNEAAALLPDDSCIVSITKSGANTATVPTKCERLWSFTQHDWFEMFGDRHVGHLSFVQDDISMGGDLIGYWVCIIPIKKENLLDCAPISTERRRLTTRPYQSLAVCMIAKDAEEWIVKCMKHILPVADKVVIALDDRTSDHTAEILEWLDKEGKIEVRHTQFEDFAQMRNQSIENIDEDWILWVDTDEMLVENLKLRRYLQGPMLEGFSIKQCHLMLDVHGTYDVPVRLLRNRPYYKFVGCIHEHCEDTRHGYDSPIMPSMLIEDVSLAHYGYLNEKQRRIKCSNRNMDLLLKDVEVNGKNGRMLTWVLLMRDYLNHVKWIFEKNQAPVIQPGSYEHKQVIACVKTFLEKFQGSGHRYEKMAFPMYQEALELLSINQLCFEGRKTPPFNIALGLAAAMGKGANEKVEAKTVWFLDKKECLAFFDKQVKRMLVRLGTTEDGEFEADIKAPIKLDYDYDDDIVQQLQPAAGAIHETTGQLR